MSSSGGMFSLRELSEDRWFVGSLLGSIAGAGLVLAGIAVVNYRNKIPVRPIAEVVRLDDANNNSAAAAFDVKPISQITAKEQKAGKPVAWAGYVISLRDLCEAKGGFSKGFSSDFQQAKVVIPEGSSWTVATANLSSRDCSQVRAASERSPDAIYAIFDTKLEPIANKQVKAWFTKQGDDVWHARPVPSQTIEPVIPK